MLTLTDNANALVQDLTSGKGEASGLRLAMATSQQGLEVTIVPEPQPTDQVVSGTDARVYVAEEVTEMLEDKMLDAAKTPEGIGFSLQSQDGGLNPQA